MGFSAVLETSAKGRSSSSYLRILLAEDDPANQKVTLLILKRLGYLADAVGNGLEALKALENAQYHLILMDLVMPGMDGLAAAKEIRKRLSPSCQPVIIAITAYILPDGRERCLAAGMDDYLIKPVAIQDLERVIKKYTPIIGEPV